MKQLVTIVAVVFAVVTLITITFTLNQVNQESARLENDLQSRSSLLADGLKETVEPNFINKSDTYLQALVERYANKQRIAGLAVIDNQGNIIAVSSSLPKQMKQAQVIATNVMDADKASGNFAIFNGSKLYVYATPLHDKKSVVGALLVVQNASYIDSQLLDIWTGNVIRIIAQALLLSLTVLLIFRWLIYEPIQRMVLSLRQSRLNSGSKSTKRFFSNPLFNPLIKEVSHMQRSLVQARLAAQEEARATLEKFSSPWTPQRLQEYIKDTAKGRKIFLVSNREPYSHTKVNNTIRYTPPASGMVSALEPVMQSCGGTWIACGSGDADKEVVDNHDRIAVPPDEPKYTLRRVWLTKEEEQGYYNGFSNEGLWPLCHRAYTRPIFRKEDWEEYQAVNKKFAQAVLSEMKGVEEPIVFVQDFHLSLVPRLIKEKRPDATIGIFWHIPWPHPESFSICPWKKEILDGILGADIVGFHTQLHCNNFIETVGRGVESLIDLERFTVTRNGHTSYIKPFPISIALPRENTQTQNAEKEKLLKDFGIKTPFIGLGVDRLDYTKGIMERLKAVEIFLTNYPSFKDKFTFLQISVPSRTKVKRYQEFRKQVEDEAERINALFKKNSWKPIVLSLKQYSQEEVFTLYRLANFCLVTPLDDGMNLVAKEFVASRTDEEGVLILSEFTGASRELTQALIINPYNAEQIADTIKTALEMTKAEQSRRMKSMQEDIKTHNVYLWSANIIKSLTSLG